MKADWISLIEAGYCLEGDDQQWLDGHMLSMRNGDV